MVITLIFAYSSVKGHVYLKKHPLDGLFILANKKDRLRAVVANLSASAYPLVLVSVFLFADT